MPAAGGEYEKQKFIKTKRPQMITTVVYDVLKPPLPDKSPCVAVEAIDMFVASFGGFAQKEALPRSIG